MSKDQRKSAPAPVVRQLDFTLDSKASANAIGNGSRNLILSEHPQARMESRLLALAQSQKMHACEDPRSPPLLVSQTRPPPGRTIDPSKSSPRAFPLQVKSPSIRPRLAQVVKTALMPKPATMKAESPKSWERCNPEQKDGTPTKPKQCNCKNSRCLKLYCECFASGTYCDGCNCNNCYNQIQYEPARKEVIDAILERNPDAFRPKVANSPHGAMKGGAEHSKGCHCRKSGCLKRYCECFQANILCSDKCKCVACKNFEGSEERKALFNAHPSDSLTSMQQAATNAAINGAVGTSCKKSGTQQILFGMMSTNGHLTSHLPETHQEICLTSNANYKPVSVHPTNPVHGAASEPSKSFYRSPLAGILQLQHVENLCALLVEVSAEAAKSHSDDKNNQDQHEAGELNKEQENRDRTMSLESPASSIEIGRPMSPGTIALMCDEQVTCMIEEDSSAITELNTGNCMRSEFAHDLNQLYAEKERLVLTRFHSFLNTLITRGCIEESKIEQEARKLGTESFFES